jgi:F420H(2)-dependent quinone reductase
MAGTSRAVARRGTGCTACDGTSWMQIKLTTMGRRTGEPRTVTLYAWEHEGGLLVVGSRGGAAHDPAWAENLRATRSATIHRGKTSTPVRVRELAGAERETAWATAVARFPSYAAFQRRTERVIPVFRLDEGSP